MGTFYRSDGHICRSDGHFFVGRMGAFCRSEGRERGMGKEKWKGEMGKG